jgi:amino acid adenylation domain-containing protein
MSRLLQDGPSRQASCRPESAAVVLEDESLTYGALEADSNRLARALRDAGFPRGERAALMVPKGPDAIVGMLGVLKAGGTYVPVDVGNPARRVARILERSEAGWILATRAAEALLAEVLGERPPRIAWLDRQPPGDGASFRPALTRDALGAFSSEPVDSGGSPTDAAHILFTSGSTGEPKGVVITHANVLAFLDWAIPYFGAGPEDRHSGHPPLHFDLSTFDIYGTLSTGARLHLVPPALNLLPGKLAEFIRRSELTQWFSVPSTLSYMAKFDVVRDGDFQGLRRLLWCGEVFPTPALVYWMRKLPHVRFTNLYGPTEATIASSYYTVPACPDSDSASIPIGTACPGEELLVLDEALAPVPAGEIGDLYIRGVGLSPGYWRDPEKTSAAFRPDPARPGDRIYKTGDLARHGEDGPVYYVGRSDSQIKSRGYRIELGEIEAALGAVPGLVEGVVLAVDAQGFEGKTICCAYVPADGGGLNPVALRRALGTALPSYMLPSRWMALPTLPRNQSGKIDRRALGDAFLAGQDRTGGDAPAS